MTVIGDESVKLRSWSLRVSDLISGNAAAIVVGLLILIVWEVGARVFGLPSYIAPSPLQVVEAFRENWYLLLTNIGPTMFEALLGFFVGNAVAILFAICFIHSRFAERAFYPLLVFLHTVPMLAIAPILVLIFGNGIVPKILIASLICFFPMLVNMVRGLRDVSHGMLELMRLMSATNSEIFWKVRVQSSLPYFFAALKISSTTCVIGAIVAEWIGSSYGLGALIIDATYNFKSALLYAVVFCSAMMAILIFSIMTIAERRLIFWRQANG